MIVILPRFEDGALDKLINQLSEETMSEILDFDSLYARPVEVEIPKFTVEESIDLTIVSTYLRYLKGGRRMFLMVKGTRTWIGMVFTFLQQFCTEKPVPVPCITPTIFIGFQPFKKLGLAGLFGNETDFSALTEGENGIHFSDAIHKSRVDVDEEGTEAAAATAVFSFRSSRPLEPTIFKANHPFMYLIFDKVTQNILFMGAYQLPAKKAFARKLRH